MAEDDSKDQKNYAKYSEHIKLTENSENFKTKISQHTLMLTNSLLACKKTYPQIIIKFLKKKKKMNKNVS